MTVSAVAIPFSIKASTVWLSGPGEADQGAGLRDPGRVEVRASNPVHPFRSQRPLRPG